MTGPISPEILEFVDEYVKDRVGSDNVARVRYATLREALQKKFGVLLNTNQIAGMLKRSREDQGFDAPPSILKPRKQTIPSTPQVEEENALVLIPPPPSTFSQPEIKIEGAAWVIFASPALPLSKAEEENTPPESSIPRASLVLSRTKERKPAHIPRCQWPFGDPGTKGFRFCDDPTTPGRPYCKQHAAVAYVPNPRRASADA